MIPQEISILMKHHVREGEPVKRVAERFGVSRQTVYNHLKREGGYQKERQVRTSKLDPYREYIVQRLSKFDLPATTLLREVREQGYEGQITILRDFVRATKGERVKELTERFETMAGEQAQLDWGECGTVMEGGKRKKLYVFVFVLGYSRMLFARFTTSTKQHVLLACLKEAFEELGVPKELLVDNMKQAVVRHNNEGVEFNRTFLDFCEHYSVVPVAAPPYWPRVKGKVERGVGYLKGSFLTGRSFVDLDDLNAQLELWLASVANVRLHGTTGERPLERFQHEQLKLRAAAGIPAYDTRPIVFRQVATDSHIRYCGVAYSVPPETVGKTVTVRASGERVGDQLEVHLGSELLVVHSLAPSHQRRVTLAEHERAIRSQARRRRNLPKRECYQQLSDDVYGVPNLVVQQRSLESYQLLLEAPA